MRAENGLLESEIKLIKSITQHLKKEIEINFTCSNECWDLRRNLGQLIENDSA